MENNWQKYTGEYEKEFYDIQLNDGSRFYSCWPNAGVFYLPNGEAIDEEHITYVRVSEDQGP